MCVSAEASFAVGALLLPASGYCIRASLRQKPTALALAAIPLFFGVQQFCEGLTWLGLGQSNPDLTRIGSLAFLFFALAFWPFWMPLATWLVETQPGRKKVLVVIVILSLSWGVFLFFPLATDPQRWLTVEQVHHSIQYSFPDLPVYRVVPSPWLRFLYLLTISVPFVLCSDRRFLIFGCLLAASALLAHLVFTYAFVSVWCFFSALLALYLCWVFRKPGLASAATA
ncbi:MAG: DUF6629 family protein [Gemmataceae bacterium]